MDHLAVHRERSSSQLFPIFLGLSLEQRDIYAVLELSSCPEIDWSEDQEGKETVLCLMEIPDLMIPCDILTFFEDSLASIQCFRIFRHYLYTEKYVGLLFFSDVASANAFMHQYNQQVLSTLFEGICDLRPVTSISFQTKWHHIPLTEYHLLRQNCNDMNLDVLTSSSEFEVMQYLSDNNVCRQRSRSDHSEIGSELVFSSPNSNKELCALCLEALSSNHPQSIVLYCGHSFHSECLIRAEGMFCPVCRFQHAQSMQQIPLCHYCRHLYTAPFSSHCAADGREEASCNKSDSTPVRFPWKSPPPAPSTSTFAESSLSEMSAAASAAVAAGMATEIARDIWLCLVCGVTSCGQLQGNHRMQHFHETRHAYAMQVFTRRVYDFAEGGYVHRLVLQHTGETALPSNISAIVEGTLTEDLKDADEEFEISQPLELAEKHSPMFHLETNMEHLSAPSESKSMEYPSNSHPSPHANASQAWTRPLHPPPVILPKDEEHVAYKLEDLLQQYNEVLAWRMQQTREHYESQLRRIWHHNEEDLSSAREEALTASESISCPSSSSATAASTVKKSKAKRNSQSNSKEGLFWLRRLQTSLQQEKQKWLMQNETLRHKLRMSEREMQDALTMVEQLRANEPIWQQQVKAQEAVWRKVQQEQQAEKEKLEQKVAQLMQRLENATQFATSTRPSNRVCETAPGDDEDS